MRVPTIVTLALPFVAMSLFAGTAAMAVGPLASQVNARTPLVYVSDATNNLIDIFDLHGRQVGELTKGLNAPVGMFVDKQHRLWVANSGANDVLVYERGARTPSKTLTQDGQFHPNDVTLCRDGTAFVANAFNAGGIAVYPPGKTKPTRYLQPEFSGAGGDEFFVTCDSMGNVFANGFIGLSPVLATTAWLNGRQSGYAFTSYAYDGGIKATPHFTLLTNG